MKRFLILVLASLLLSACEDGECVPFDGVDYNWDKVAAVHVGTLASDLKEQIGVPLSVTRVSTGEEDWRYFCRCKRTSWVHAGVIKFRSGGATMHSESIVRLRDGRVEKIVKNDVWLFE